MNTTMLEYLLQLINSLPEYIGQGIFGIIITVIAGTILGIITSGYFYRKDELTRIEGLLLEKKILLYKDIFGRVESLNNLVKYEPINCNVALEMMKNCNIELPQSLHCPKVFEDADEMRKTFLEIDKFATENKLFYDNDVAYAMFIFQNYLLCFIRFQVMFREQIEHHGKSMNKDICAVEHQLMLSLGFMLKDDLFLQTQKVSFVIRNSINNLSFSHRIAPTYRYEDFNNSESSILKELSQTKVIAEKEKITNLITNFVSIGLTI